MRSTIRVSVFVAASLAAPGSFGASADRPQVEAQLLDHAEFLCANCFFGPSEHYYCFAAGDQVLIGYQKTPVLNWQDKSKNYLATAHRAWAPWAAPGQTVPISFDDKHIWVSRSDDTQFTGDFWAHMKGFPGWVSRTHSKQVKLTRSSLRDIFIHNDTCRGADRAKAPSATTAP